jgi:hypothetical protein
VPVEGASVKRMDSPRRRGVVVAIAWMLVALGAGPASAAEIFPSVSPPILRDKPPYTATYRFEFHTGPNAEQPLFTVDGPDLATATLEGPGSITGRAIESSTRVRSCLGGRGTTSSSVDTTAEFALSLPAETVNTLVVTAVRKTPIGLGDGYGYSFSFGPDLATSQPVLVPDPRLYVRRTVPVSIRAKLGRAVVLSGRTTPQIAGQRILLRYTTKWPARWHRLTVVRVRRDGSFAYRPWVPRKAGLYTVQAYYISHDPHFLSSATGCGATFKVT